VARLAARAAVGCGLVLELVDRRPADGTRARWYGGIHLQPVLWGGGVDVVRQWGRVGGRHRPRRLVTPHATEGAARAALLELPRWRLRRGYLPAR
jgi:predicted DNA-binding WGR domain protein